MSVRLVVAGWWLACAGVLSAAWPAAALGAGRLYAVLACDTADENVGPWVATDSFHMYALLLGNVDPGRLNENQGLIHISGDQLGANQILTAIRNLPSDGDDTVLVYFSGHGAYNEEEGHFFQLRGPEGNLQRSKVQRAIEAKQPRLGILISDCCYAYVKKPPVAMAPRILQPATTTPAFLSLLFQVRGVVDLTSSQPGEYSAVGPEPGYGSLFTTALYQFLDQNRNRRLTWPMVFEAVQDRAATQFKNQYPNGIENQFTQTAYAFRLKATPVEPPPPPPPPSGGPGNTSRLGVLATEQPGGGVRVLEVWADYPGTQSRVRETGERLNLEPGDVILAVNGQAIRSLQEYVALVKNSPPEIDLLVRDQRTGRQVNLRTTLRSGSGTGPSPGARRSRFGVLAVNNDDGQGVRITEVWDGYPGQAAKEVATGESMRLEPGDVIVAINDQPLNSLQDYVNAVKGSPREMRFTVRDGRTGNLLKMKATLRD